MRKGKSRKTSKPSICSQRICFEDETIEKLRYLADEKSLNHKHHNHKRVAGKEISGKLIAVKKSDGYKLVLENDSKLFGKSNLESNEADFIESHYNFHTHPYEAYLHHNCDLGWPSKDDYITYLDGFLNYDVIFHCISTVEGIYIVRIAKDAIIPLKTCYSKLKTESSQEKFIDKIDAWVMSNLNIDKINYKKQNGVKPKNSIKSIHSPLDYVNFINNYPVKYTLCNKQLTLFDIKFIDWNSLSPDFCFNFYHAKVKGKCPVTLNEYKFKT